MGLQRKNHKPKICIIGPGVVGQATGKYFSHKGFPVTFWGLGSKTVKQLNSEGFTAYTLEAIKQIPYDFDISMITVPTPAIDGKISLDAIRSVSMELGSRLKETKNYHVVVVKSTVPPGTTENLVLKTVEKYSGNKVGRDFGVCMNPEFLREKSAHNDFLNSRLVLIGEYDKKSGDTLASIYRDFNCPLQRVSIKEAEMQKYVHNLFNAVKISFFNEMRGVCKHLGISAEKIFPAVAHSAEGMWNPKYGIRNFGPFDGMCLPKDSQAFLEWAKGHNLQVPVLESAVQFNTQLQQKTISKKSLQGNGEYKKGIPLKKSDLSISNYAL